MVHQSDQVLVTEWMDGIPLADVIADGTPEQRDRAGQLLARFLFSGPARTGLLHADPHPGNFRLLPPVDAPGAADAPHEVDGPEASADPDGSGGTDGSEEGGAVGAAGDWRLGVLDFGTVDRLPGGLPGTIGESLRMTLEGDAAGVYGRLRDEGFVKESIDLEPDEVLDYLLPIIEPAQVEEFTFSRGWLRDQAARIADPRSPAHQLGRQLNLPPSYLLIHRVTLSTIGVLCQLGAAVRLRDELEAWLPGFVAEDEESEEAGEAKEAGAGSESEEPEPEPVPGATRRRSPPEGVEAALDRSDVEAGAALAEVEEPAVLHGGEPGQRGRTALGGGAAAGADHGSGGRFFGGCVSSSTT